MPQGAGAGELMGYAGAVTALVAVVIALSQKDAKRLLAYHSISQIGYVVCAWGAAIKVGIATAPGLGLMTAAFLHALYHALFKGLLFMTVGTTIDRARGRNVYKLRGSISILRREGKEKFPVTFLCFLTGALAISAVPPFNGFASKTAITYALKGTWQYYLLTAAGIGTAASFIKLSRIYWPLKKAETRHPAEPVIQEAQLSGQDARDSVIFPAVWGAELVLGLLCLGSGLAAPVIYSLVTELFAADNGIAAGAVPAFYTLDNLIKTIVILICGFAVFKLVDTKAGGAVLRVIRERPGSFQGLFMSFALGTAALAAWLLFYR
jgi:multicomponent Na+:H+ antiporter subunit D